MKIKLNRATKTLLDVHKEYVGTITNTTTQRGYNVFYATLTRYIEPTVSIDSINSTVIKQLTNSLENSGNKNVSNNNVLSYFRMLLRYSEDCGYITTVPKIKMLKNDSPKKVPLNEDEIQRLLKQPINPNYIEYRDFVEVNLMLATGIRSRNVREVLVSDLDLSSKTLFLRSTKNGNAYTIYLSNSIVSLLRTYLSMVKLDDTMPLFPNAYGKPQTHHSFECSLKKYFISRDVERCTPHLLRHTYAHNLAKSNVPVPIISQLLCHSNINVTMRYINIMDEDVRDVADSIDLLEKFKPKKMRL